MPKKKSRAKRIMEDNRKLIYLSFIFSALTLSLVVSMWLGIYPQDIAMSFIDNVDYIEAQKVYMPQEIKLILDTRYESDSSEFIYCIYGEVYEDGYKMNEIKSTKVISASEDYIQYEGCRVTSDFIGTIHSHPQPEEKFLIATCELSEQDIYSFGAEGYPLIGVICGVGRYGFYTPNDFRNSLRTEIIA